MTDKKNSRHVFLLAGGTLALLLFLSGGAGIVFNGLLTGILLFASFFFIMSWQPQLKKWLLNLGGGLDLLVSFGLPALVLNVLEIKGTTMMIGTATAGLLFTLLISGNKAGGPRKALISAAVDCVDEAKKFAKGVMNDLEDARRSSSGNDTAGAGGEQQEAEKEAGREHTTHGLM